MVFGMEKPGHDDPTQTAEKLRELMAESFRVGQKTEDDKIDALTTCAHESLRVALNIERENHGLD